MVGFKNGHIRKNLIQKGEPQRYSWGTQTKKKVLAILCWVSFLEEWEESINSVCVASGVMNIELELKEQTLNFSVSPVQAALIMQFQDQSE